MDDYHITSKKLVVFSVAMSFVVAVIGTILALGVIGPVFGLGEVSNSAPFVFNRPKIIERILPSSEEEKPAAQEQIIREEGIVIRVVEASLPAVVSIVASKDVPVIEQYYEDPLGGDPFFRRFFGDIPQYRSRGTEKREISSGTGFIVSGDGYIVTNKHVVADPEAEYTVFLNDGSKKSAQVTARDPLQDLAVLKIDASNLPTLKMGDSSKVKIGSTVIAIGNALEFRNTVSVGVVSGLHRSIVAQGGDGGPESLQELIQTDAAINPGNSGGPLLNLSGDVIAISTAMAQGAENIGFAIPVNKAKKAVESTRQSGKIMYPFLGVHYMVITKNIAQEQKLARDYGVLLVSGEGSSAVVAGSPAAKAGLREHDIIIALDGSRIDENHSLASIIQEHNVGDEVTLRVVREGREMDVKITLEERK